MVRIVRTQTSRGFYVTLTLATLAADDGSEHQREVVSFGQSVCVLPYDPVRKLGLVVRLTRAPLLLAGEDTKLIEAPAGMIDHGEAPETAVRREALEEAGLDLRTLEPVATCWTSPGVVAERSHLFLAPYGEDDRKGRGGGLAEEHEDIFTEEIPLSRLWAFADGGELRDLKTLTLTLALRARHPELF
jgi:nudix-type nucleoside diphosphatase (YffH/AdpP family)